MVLKSGVMFSKGLYMALLFLEYLNNTLGGGGGGGFSSKQFLYAVDSAKRK